MPLAALALERATREVLRRRPETTRESAEAAEASRPETAAGASGAAGGDRRQTEALDKHRRARRRARRRASLTPQIPEASVPIAGSSTLAQDPGGCACAGAWAAPSAQRQAAALKRYSSPCTSSPLTRPGALLRHRRRSWSSTSADIKRPAQDYLQHVVGERPGVWMHSATRPVDVNQYAQELGLRIPEKDTEVMVETMQQQMRAVTTWYIKSDEASASSTKP